VRFRHPGELEESVLDVLAGLAFLEGEGVEEAVLTGHSFGGAVVLQAAAASPAARGVVTLATQTYGAGAVAELGRRCPVLLVHGEADRVLPAACSKALFRRAGGPARLVLYPGAGHGLDEFADQVHELLAGWVPEQLRRARKS
jgi:pimeloyl-ACP methyl ester carboxylesterase